MCRQADLHAEVLAAPNLSPPLPARPPASADLTALAPLPPLVQKLAEQLYMLIISVAAVVGFLAGYVEQSFNLMLGIFAAGVGLACLATVPDWPWFNRHPLTWLKPQPKQDAGGPRGKKKPEATWKNFWNLF